MPNEYRKYSQYQFKFPSCCDFDVSLASFVSLIIFPYRKYGGKREMKETIEMSMSWHDGDFSMIVAVILCWLNRIFSDLKLMNNVNGIEKLIFSELGCISFKSKLDNIVTVLKYADI